MLRAPFGTYLGLMAAGTHGIVHNIAVIGVGGTGTALLPLLASLSASGITMIDGDTVEERNLVRQLLFTAHDVSRLKADAVAERLRTIYPVAQWRSVARFIDAGNCTDLVRGHSVVADCTDDLVARGVIARTCATLGIPLVSGAVHGRQIQIFTQSASTHGPRTSFFKERPAEEQEGCDMQQVPAAVTTIAASLMAMRIEDLLNGGHGHAGMMDLVDTEHGRWMRVMGPDAGELLDTPVSPMHHV